MSQASDVTHQVSCFSRWDDAACPTLYAACCCSLSAPSTIKVSLDDDQSGGEIRRLLTSERWRHAAWQALAVLRQCKSFTVGCFRKSSVAHSAPSVVEARGCGSGVCLGEGRRWEMETSFVSSKTTAKSSPAHHCKHRLVVNAVCRQPLHGLSSDGKPRKQRILHLTAWRPTAEYRLLIDIPWQWAVSTKVCVMYMRWHTHTYA